MTDDQFVLAVQKLISQCQATAASNPGDAAIWLDRVQALTELVESEVAPVIAFRPSATTTTTTTTTTTAKLNQWAKELKKRDRANDAEAPNPSPSEDTSADDGSKARAK